MFHLYNLCACTACTIPSTPFWFLQKNRNECSEYFSFRRILFYLSGAWNIAGSASGGNNLQLYSTSTVSQPVEWRRHYSTTRGRSRVRLFHKWETNQVITGMGATGIWISFTSGFVLSSSGPGLGQVKVKLGSGRLELSLGQVNLKTWIRPELHNKFNHLLPHKLFLDS